MSDKEKTFGTTTTDTKLNENSEAVANTLKSGSKAYMDQGRNQLKNSVLANGSIESTSPPKRDALNKSMQQNCKTTAKIGGSQE